MFSLGFTLLCLITFLSAFLLFQIELIIAKLFLPSYGGSYLVWGACIVFFQAALLVGYLFAHKAIEYFGTHRYLKIHLGLLVLPFLFFPGHNIQVDAQAGSLPLVLDIFVRLALTIGPVFFVLSTASLVTQSWLSQSSLSDRKHPYILYAVSNIGSFVALWSYPFVFEYLLTNTEQLNIWRALYVVLVLLTVWSMRMVKADQVVNDPKLKDEPVDRLTALRWLILSAAGVVMFMSVTNIITYEAAPVPLLWIIPLSIYLLSFILTFRAESYLGQWMGKVPYFALPLAAGLYFQSKLSFLAPGWSIILFNSILLVLCLYTQNELIRSRPTKGGLTFFYVMISLGGFIGGFVTSWIVPLISNSPVEFLIGLGLIAVAYPTKIGRIVLLVGVVVALVFNMFFKTHDSVVKKRNYYGIYDIFDKNNVRTFLHGTTMHGVEWVLQDRRFIPLGYYSPFSPMGRVFTEDIFAAKRVGAIGLGAGTVAMYSTSKMPIDFYELDPDVLGLAERYFWYLGMAPGPIKVIIGDARVSLSKSDAIYDVLLIDAFGGDAIPFHLVNKDVVMLYRSHLSSHGGILFHIPNRYFNLEPILSNIAKDLGAFAAVKEAKQDGITMRTFWAVLTWDRERYERLVRDEGWTTLDSDQFKPMRTWSDDYSTILPVLKWGELLESLKHFKIF